MDQISKRNLSGQAFSVADKKWRKDMDTVDTRSASVPEDGEKIIELPSKSQGWECRTSEKDDSIRKGDFDNDRKRLCDQIV